MGKIVCPLMLLAVMFSLIPVMVYADTADECDRVGALIDNVQIMINRSGPVILRSGNRQAINILNEAVGHFHAARRAYNNDHCRLAFNQAQTAISLIRQAMRLVNRSSSY